MQKILSLNLLARATSLAAITMLGACTIETNNSSSSSENKHETLVHVSSAGVESCPLGGYMIEQGDDINGNGVLDPDEVLGVPDEICSGEVNIVPEPRGNTCAAGGFKISFVLDASNEDTYICHGNPPVVDALDIGSSACPHGGYALTFGEEDPISICHGGNGVNGQNGQSAYELWLTEGNTGSAQDFLNSLKGDAGATGAQGAAGFSAYELWISLGNTGNEEDFLNSLKGGQGADGANGNDGANGQDGQSAYELWQANGNTGTVQDFLNSLKGETGAAGEQGATGATGLSAYDLWTSLGNTGTEEDFLNSLKGEQGAEGVDGATGQNGEDGLQSLAAISEIPAGDSMCLANNGGALINFALDIDGDGVLNEDEIAQGQSSVVCNGADGANGLDALQPLVAITEIPVGDTMCLTGNGGLIVTFALDVDGNGELSNDEISAGQSSQVCNGSNGASAYEIWLAESNTGSIQDFLDSLKGETGAPGTSGANGLSAYEIWLSHGNTGSEQDFLESLKGENGSNSAFPPLVKVQIELPGLNCNLGGQKMLVGTDNGLGEFFETEPAAYFLCNTTARQLLLNDTGSISSFDFDTSEVIVDICEPYSLFDCEYGWDAYAANDQLFKIEEGADAGFDFTRLNPDSGKVAEIYSPSVCVQDNYTDLIWWVVNNQSGYKDYAEINSQLAAGNFNRCGSTNWRIPTLKELQTIIHYGSTSDYFLDEKYFDISTIAQAGEPSVWIRNNLNAYETYALSIKDGTIKPVSNTNANHTILVRGAK